MKEVKDDKVLSRYAVMTLSPGTSTEFDVSVTDDAAGTVSVIPVMEQTATEFGDAATLTWEENITFVDKVVNFFTKEDKSADIQISDVQGVEKGLDDVDDADFASSRLVVMTDKDSVFTDKDTVIGHYGNIYLVQYDSVAKTKEAYTRLKDKVKAVEPDKDVTAATNEVTATLLAEETTESEDTVVEDATEESSEDVTEEITETVNADNAIAGLNDLKTSKEVQKTKGVIALIDTGVSESDNVIARVSMIDDALEGNGHGDKMLANIVSQDAEAKVLSIRAMNDNGFGTVSSLVAAMEYAIDQKVDYINLSLYARTTLSTSVLEEEIVKATKAGITVVGAAGNDGADVKDYVPGSVEEAYIIGAAKDNGARQELSNFGSTVDYNVVAESTSDATALFTGYISANDLKSVKDVLNKGLIYATDYNSGDIAIDSVVKNTDLSKYKVDKTKKVIVTYTFAHADKLASNDTLMSIYGRDDEDGKLLGMMQDTPEVYDVGDGTYKFKANIPMLSGVAVREYQDVQFAQGNDSSQLITEGCSLDKKTGIVTVSKEAMNKMKADDSANMQVQVLVPVKGDSDNFSVADAGGAGGGSGTGGEYTTGKVVWAIHDHKDRGFGITVDDVKNVIKNNMGVKIGDEQWNTDMGTNRKIQAALSDAIKQCKNNYIAIYGSEKGFKPRIVAVGVCAAWYPKHGGYWQYNASCSWPVESAWSSTWTATGSGLTLYHGGKGYTINSEFHNGKTSLTYFATEQLAGLDNIRIIVLDETQPTPPEKYTWLSIEKTWDDQNNKFATRPQSVTVELIKDGKATGQTKTLNGGNNWSAKWTDLLYESSTETHTYDIKEHPIAGYTNGKIDWTGSYEKGWTGTVTNTANLGYLKLHKSSSLPDITDKNPCYNLSGAVYKVYTDEACTNEAIHNGDLITDKDGNTGTVELKPGDYWVKETKTTDDEHYYLNDTVYPVTVTEGSTTDSPVGLDVEDEPGNDPAGISVTKIWKGEKTATVPPLTGTQFTVCYYAGKYDKSNLPSAPTRKWVLKVQYEADIDKYMTALTDDYLVPGESNELYKDEDGYTLLPFGTYTIQETKEAAGYTLEGSFTDQHGHTISPKEIYLTQVLKKGDAIKLDGGNEYASEDSPKPSKITLKKFDTDGKTPLAGAKFELKNAKGEVVATKTTGDDGVIEFTDLYPDIYTITELETKDRHTLLKEPITVKCPMTVTDDDIKKYNIDKSQCVYDEEQKVYYIFNQTYNVTNDASFEVPMTGGVFTPKMLIPLAVGLVIMTGALFISLRKKRSI